jgi:hypothetical protein
MIVTCVRFAMLSRAEQSLLIQIAYIFLFVLRSICGLSGILHWNIDMQTIARFISEPAIRIISELMIRPSVALAVHQLRKRRRRTAASPNKTRRIAAKLP